MEASTSSQGLRHDWSLEERDREGRGYNKACYHESHDTEDEQQVGTAGFFLIVLLCYIDCGVWRVLERLEINV